MARLNRKGRAASSRDAGGFAAIPWAVFDSAAYQALSHPAKSLLMEIARQYHRDDNGRMIVTLAYLKPRGWTSNATITKAKNELLAAGLIYETVKGRRPNRASWYACTWWTLDKLDGYDQGAAGGFERSAYLRSQPRKIACFTPRDGVQRSPIAPRGGVKPAPSMPRDGAMHAILSTRTTPPDGDPLDMPSPNGIGRGAVIADCEVQG